MHKLRRIVGTRFQVLFHSPPGVLFTFPSRYLSAIGHRGVFRLNGWSRQIHAQFQESRVTRDNTKEDSDLRLQGSHPLRRTIPGPSTSPEFYHFSPARQNQQCAPTTPHGQQLPSITSARFSLIRFRSPLLTESLLFSLPVGTEMFHFPTFPPNALCVQAPVTRHDSGRVSPFGHPRITARLSAPQGLSQTPTSFIGSRCQGIHHVPLVACKLHTLQRHSRPL